MTNSEILVAARKLIEKPGNWCQGAYAKDANGDYVDFDSLSATRFCVGGALDRVFRSEAAFNRPGYKEIRQVLNTLSSPLSFLSFNDGTDHAAVLDLLDKGIAHFREKE